MPFIERVRLRFIVITIASLLAACGGGGGAGGVTPVVNNGPQPTPTSAPTLPPSSTQSATLGASTTTFTLPKIASGVSATVTMPSVASGSATATLTLTNSLPNGVVTPSSRIHKSMHAASLGAAVSPIAYVLATVNSAVTINHAPAFAFTFPTGTLNGYAYAAVYDPTKPSAGWNAMAGPVGPMASGATSLSFPSVALAPPVTLAANVTYIFAIVETGTPLPTPTPVATATPYATPTPHTTPTPTATPTGGSSPTPGPVLGSATKLPAVEAPNGGWSAYDVAQTLQFPVQSGWNGAGQTVAIVMDSYPSPDDLTTYQTTFNIPQTGRTIALTPSPDGTPDPFSDAGEVTLDAETVAGLAPGANISIYGMPGLNAQNFTDTVNAITTANSASVISFSAGGCEYSGITTDPVFHAAADAGIAVIASAGDEGNVCGSHLNVGVNHPASDPYITGVGGSETERPDFDLTSNTVWNDEACGQQCAGGGGVSQYFTLPSYQQGLAGAASMSFRNVPDAAMPAMSTAVYQGDWQLIGGTSWSAPEYAALMAELYQYCNSKIQDPVVIPYYVQQQDKSALIDVIHGDNQFNGTTPLYAAHAGYDNASGVGVPFGMKYSNVVCPGRSFATSSIRRHTTLQRMSVARPAEAYAVNVTPRVRNLIDEGRRPLEAQTRIQIALRYDAGAAAGESTVIDSLRKAGFTIVRTFRNHLVVDAVAPSGTVESFFRTELHNLQQSGHGVRYMPVRQAVVPANLAPYVAAVNLDNVITMRHKLTRYTYGLQF